MFTAEEEAAYLQANPDVAQAVAAPGGLTSGYEHYALHGYKEAKRGGVPARMQASSVTPTETTDIGALLTPLQQQVSGLGAGQTGLMSGQAGLQTGITGLEAGQAGLQTGQAGLAAGQAGLATGQTGLAAGQADLATGQTGLAAGQTGLATGIADVGTQVGDVGAQVGDVQTGVTGLGAAIGAPAEGDPRTLFEGQAGLMSGQTALGEQIGGGVDRLTGEITNVGADLTALQRASDAYQREAQRQRALAQQAGETGRQQIGRQVAGVGQQANRLAELQAAQRLAATPRGMMQMAAGVTPASGQQVAAQTAQAAQQGFRPPAQGVPAPVSPLGPQTQDPRDLVTQLQQLQARQQGLMAQLGI